MEILVIAPCVRLTIGLSQPDNDWFLCSSTQHRPNLSSAMHLSRRRSGVILNHDVAAKANSIAGMYATPVIRNRILGHELVCVFAHNI
jgi:hypothetical protein